MSEISKISGKATSRIQSHANRTGTNKGFKARAQSAATKNEAKELTWKALCFPLV